MKCKQCKFDNDCKSRNKGNWIEGEGRSVLGCTLGELLKESYAIKVLTDIKRLVSKEQAIKLQQAINILSDHEDIILGRDSKIEILEEKLKEQQDVGEIFFKDKIYKVMLKEVEIRNDKINLDVSKMENTQPIT